MSIVSVQTRRMSYSSLYLLLALYLFNGQSINGLSMLEPEFEPDPSCAETPDSGEGQQLLHHWYFNVEIAQCRELLYKGMGGSPNRFETRKECERRCLRHYTEGADEMGPDIKSQVDHKPRTPKKILSHRYGPTNVRMNRRGRYGFGGNRFRGQNRRPFISIGSQYQGRRQNRMTGMEFNDYY